MKIIADYYLKEYTIDVEPSDTILDIKNKLIKLNLGSYDIVIKRYMLFDVEKNKSTVKDLNLQEGDKIIVRNGYEFYVNFDNKKYELQGEGCACCKDKELLYKLMENYTGISREDFNLVHDGIILEREFGLKKTYKSEFDMILKDNIKKLKIKMHNNNYFYITYKDSLTYDKIFKLLAESCSRRLFGGEILKGIVEKFRLNKKLIINGKIINENDDFNKIENHDEIILISKSDIDKFEKEKKIDE